LDVHDPYTAQGWARRQAAKKQKYRYGQELVGMRGAEFSVLREKSVSDTEAKCGQK
jgi:hypothetical protein